MHEVKVLYNNWMCKLYLNSYFSSIFLLINVSKVDNLSRDLLKKYMTEENIYLLMCLLAVLSGLDAIKLLRIIQCMLNTEIANDSFERMAK